MKRERFLSEMTKSILFPYEASRIYEEEIVGEFENQLEAEYMIRFLALAKKGPTLDLACGDGRHTLHLSQRVNHVVVALDFSTNNVSMAKKKCKGRKNVTFIKGSMFNLPFRKNAFVGIWFSQAFEYVPPDRRKEFIVSVRRVLKPVGVLYMSVETWMYPSIWTSLKELWSDFRLFCYWRFGRQKPLLWGEFLYYLSSENIRARCSGWHYHVHTDKWTLFKLLQQYGFDIAASDLCDGYIYTLSRKPKTATN